MFGKPAQPRQFQYGTFENSDDKGGSRMRFRHLRYFMRDSHGRIPVRLMLFVLLIVALFYFLGGFRHDLKTVELTPADAIVKLIPVE